MRRLSVLIAVLPLAATAWWLWQHDPNDTPPPNDAPPSAAEPGTAKGNTAESPEPEAGTLPPDRRDAGRQAPDPDPFVVRGLVVGDERRPRLDDLRVVAYRGEATDSKALVFGGRTGRNRAPAFLLRGEPIAGAAVDAAGNFELHAPARHLRLTIEHPLYLLPLPRIIHVPAEGEADNVVLVPILGACLKGRLFGPRAHAITGVRATIEPDPMSMIQDMRSYLGAMIGMSRLRAAPDEDMRFTFEGIVPNASITLMAEGERAFAQSTQPPLIAGETREIALPVRAAAALAVRVVDEEGRGIEGAQVSVRPNAGASTFLPQLRNRYGHADADGLCTIPSIPPTKVSVEAAAIGYVAVERTIDLTPADEPRRLELLLREGGVVTGTVTDPDGRPLAGAHVAHHPATRIPILGDLAEQLGTAYLADVAKTGVATDDEGNFRLSGLDDDGAFLVVAAHAGFGANAVRDVHMGDSGVRITLRTVGAVRGRVVAKEDGSPIGSFTVHLKKTVFLVMQTPVRSEAVSAEDGTFVLGEISPDTYTLEIEADGRSKVTRRIDFTGDDLDVGELRLPRGGTVRGIVLGDDGDPVRGALVRRRMGAIADNPAMAMFGSGPISTRTDAEGRFELSPLPPRRLQLLASAKGYASGRSDRLKLTEGATTEGVVITLGHGGSIEGVLRPGAGNRLDDFTLMAQHQQTQASYGAALGPNGSFRFDNLDPGPYVVQAMPRSLFTNFGSRTFRQGRGMDLGKILQKISSSIVSQRCTVRAGETSEVELDAEDLLVGTRWRIEITIGGERLENGILEATSTRTGRLRAAFFGDGTAVLGDIEPGTYSVRIRSGLTLAPVGSPRLLELPADSGEFTSRIDLPGGTLRGQVLDAETGEPLSSALVRLLNEDAPERDDAFGMALTDRNGRFSFSGLADGSYGVIAVDAFGQQQGTASRRGILIVSGTASEPIELRARQASTASVVVTSGSGAPIPGATVLCVDENGQPMGALGLATTDASGKARFGGLPAGAARVVGRAPGFAPGATEVRTLDLGQPTEFSLTLTGGTRTTLHAVDAEGRPLVGAMLSARFGDGPWLPPMLLVERSHDGVFELGQLAPGSWEFRVTHNSAGTIVKSVSIGDEPAISLVVAPR